LGERLNGIQEVRGSIPLSSTREARIASGGSLAARMAELVDAQDSGSCRGNPVGVRLPLRALSRSVGPRAEIGRQAGLRDQCQKWRTGSSPVVGIQQYAAPARAIGRHGP
jgi:hypothetical protein